MAIDLTDVQQFFIDVIKTDFPNLDFRRGTSVRDTCINPAVTFLQPVANEIDAIGNRQTVRNAGSISEDDLDDLLANSFVIRRAGNKSTGTIRLLFSSPQSVTVRAGTTFRDASGNEYITRQTFTITREQMAINADSSLFFMSVVAESVEAGLDKNAAIGDIVSIEGGPTGVISVTNPSAFTSGRRRESNDEMKNREEESN